MQQYATLQTEAESAQALLTTVYANELSFSGVLLDLSRVIPSDAALTSLHRAGLRAHGADHTHRHDDHADRNRGPASSAR